MCPRVVVSKEPVPSVAPTPDDIVRDGTPSEEEQSAARTKPEGEFAKNQRQGVLHGAIPELRKFEIYSKSL